MNAFRFVTRLISAAVATALLTALSGCATAPPTSYYTLMAPAPSDRSPAADAPATPFAIEVLPVGVPEALDQPQWIVRKGDNGMAVLENERWTAPLGQEMRAALSNLLAHRLGTQDVSDLGAPAGREVLRIQVQVRRFDAWPGERIALEADWSVAQASDPKTRRTCRASLSEPAAGGYPELARAQQRALVRLSDAIARQVAQWPGDACAALSGR